MACLQMLRVPHGLPARAWALCGDPMTLRFLQMVQPPISNGVGISIYIQYNNVFQRKADQPIIACCLGLDGKNQSESTFWIVVWGFKDYVIPWLLQQLPQSPPISYGNLLFFDVFWSFGADDVTRPGVMNHCVNMLIHALSICPGGAFFFPTWRATSWSKPQTCHRNCFRKLSLIRTATTSSATPPQRISRGAEWIRVRGQTLPYIPQPAWYIYI